jgi:hypothetical protein
MPKKPQTPSTPVLEQINPAIPSPAECAKLKAEFGIKTGPYKKLGSRRGYQKHHVLQNAQIKAYIPRPDGTSVSLKDSHRGTQHGKITNRQNSRMNKKGGAGGPAKTFGELKKEARKDLADGLNGSGKSNKTGKPMTKKQAEKAALCIVKEAEDELNAKRKAGPGNKGKLPNNTTVPPPAGCLPAGTLVWLADGTARAVELLVSGDRVQTTAGPEPIARVDLCRNDLVELTIEGRAVNLATFHRLSCADGELVRADEIRPGDLVVTCRGTAVVEAVRSLEGFPTVYRLGFRRDVLCAVGEMGVWTFMPEAGPPVVRHEPLQPFLEEVSRCPS